MPYDPDTDEWIDEEVNDEGADPAVGDYGNEQNAYGNQPPDATDMFNERMREFVQGGYAQPTQPAAATQQVAPPDQAAPPPPAPQPSGPQLPRIFNQWKPGTFVEQSDPPVSPEQALAMTQARIAQLTPSHAENLQVARLQSAQNAIQTQLANGTLAPQAAAQALGLVGQQLRPLMVRRSQIPLYLARARYQQMQIQTAQRAAIMQQDMAFHAQNIQQRTRHVQLPDGSTVTVIENGGNRAPTVIDRFSIGRNTAAAAESGRTERATATALRQATENAETQVQTEINQALAETRIERRRNPDAPAIEPAFMHRLRTDDSFANSLRRYGPIDTNNVGAMRDLYERYLVDRRLGREPPARQQSQQGAQPSQPAQPAAPSNSRPSREQALRELDARLAVVANPPRTAPAQSAPSETVTPQVASLRELGAARSQLLRELLAQGISQEEARAEVDRRLGNRVN